MYNAILVAFVCVLIDLLLRLLVGGKLVNIRSAVVAVLSAKMRSMSCLHADFLVFVHSDKLILICLVVSHLLLRVLVPCMLSRLVLSLTILFTNL